MWRWILVAGCLFSLSLHAQKKWDGDAGTANWNDGANWFPDGVPVPADDVLLDNSMVTGSYSVLLPSGALTLTLSSLTLMPVSSSITLELPAGSTANPGLSLASLTLHPGAVFINASGATAGSGLSLSGPLRIMNGAKYIHRTSRSNASIIDRILIEPGTEKGIFEFDVPGTAGYTVSLTGNNFGSLSFRAAAAGGTKSYSGSGTGTLTIHGDLLVDAGAQVTSTLSADIVVKGNLAVEGKLNLNPSTAGTVARSLRFSGDGSFSGSGSLSMNANFRNIELVAGSRLTLARDLSLTLTSHSFISRGSLILGAHLILGPGSFIMADSSLVSLGDPSGISATADLGNIRTSTRSFSSRATYIYAGTSPQSTGDGLPDSLSGLGVNNAHAITLTRSVYIRDSLLLTMGMIRSSPTSILTLGSPLIRSSTDRYGQANQGNENSLISGPLALALFTDTVFTAPLGADTIFAPIRIALKDPGPVTVVVEYKPSAPPPAPLSPQLMGLGDREHWLLQSPPGTRLQVQASLRPWSIPAPSQTRPALAVLKDQWELLQGNASTIGYRWLVSDTAVAGMTALAPALQAEPILLPLGFLSFSAREDAGGIRLQWEAEEEGRPVRYRIMRSADGLAFTEIGSVQSGGKSRNMQWWLDRNPLPLAYYQLHMLMENGEVRSRIIRRTWGRTYARIYPNPVGEELHIFFSGSSSRYEVEIVSLFGTVCKKFVCNTANSQMGVSDLKRGFYLLRITDKNGSVTLPFTKN